MSYKILATTNFTKQLKALNDVGGQLWVVSECSMFSSLASVCPIVHTSRDSPGAHNATLSLLTILTKATWQMNKRYWPSEFTGLCEPVWVQTIKFPMSFQYATTKKTLRALRLCAMLNTPFWSSLHLRGVGTPNDLWQIWNGFHFSKTTSILN